MNKKVLSHHQAHAPHMVGDGLPVRNFFSYSDLGRKELSPFLMLDYGRPTFFEPTQKRLGVGMHPHRGFETVTFVFKGEIEHRDTAGNHGVIGPGDVQWMTAGSGILHEEMHSDNFRKTGGDLHFLQLWVNLPAEFKMTAPKYQALSSQQIPVLNLDDGRVQIRVIAGTFDGASGPAKTQTPVNLWDLTMKTGAKLQIPFTAGFTSALAILEGAVEIEGKSYMQESIILLDSSGDSLELIAGTDAHVVVLSGQTIDEPVVGYGPFVMNTQSQIMQAIEDLRAGRFGKS